VWIASSCCPIVREKMIPLVLPGTLGWAVPPLSLSRRRNHPPSIFLPPLCVESRFVGFFGFF